MRSSRAKSLRDKVKTFCKKDGVEFTKQFFRRIKKDYNETPRTERARFLLV